MKLLNKEIRDETYDQTWWECAQIIERAWKVTDERVWRQVMLKIFMQVKRHVCVRIDEIT